MFGLPTKTTPAAAMPVATTPTATTPQATPPKFPAFSMPKTGVAAAPGADLKYQKIMEAMMTSSIGGKRNDMPEGTGVFLVKEGIFKVTPTQGARLTSFNLYCIKGIEDGQKLTPASPQYTGPRAGETYEYAVFHDSKYPNILGSQYLQITAACMGWTPEQVKQYQSTPEGQQAIAEMTSRILCVDAHGNQVMDNGQPVSSIASNQIILEITKKSQIKNKKVNGQPVFDVTGQPVRVPVTNVYWNRRVWMTDLITQGMTEADFIKAFGSPEAAGAAFQIEAEYHPQQ